MDAIDATKELRKPAIIGGSLSFKGVIEEKTPGYSPEKGDCEYTINTTPENCGTNIRTLSPPETINTDSPAAKRLEKRVKLKNLIT